MDKKGRYLNSYESLLWFIFFDNNLNFNWFYYILIERFFIYKIDVVFIVEKKYEFFIYGISRGK